jgi:pteridine reductase
VSTGPAPRPRALVTGAGRRVGRAIAIALGKAGMRVGVHYHSSRSGAETTARSIEDAGGEALLFEADLSERERARDLVDRAVAELGGLDLLVASAASFERVPFDAVDDAAFDRSISLNLASPFALAHRAAPALKRSRGSIVFITCTSATSPYRNYLPYVVSKGALKHLMRTLAVELAPDVRVNAVAPGTILPPESTPPEALARLIRKVPLERQGDADDIARAVLFLAQSPFVTGEEILVDGGEARVRGALSAEPR